MTRKGHYLDSAVVENLFAILKTELCHNQRFENTNDLINQIKEYIEYNNKRIKAKFKRPDSN